MNINQLSRIASLVAGYICLGFVVWNWDREPYLVALMCVFMFLYAGFHAIKISGFGLEVEAEKKDKKV